MSDMHFDSSTKNYMVTERDVDFYVENHINPKDGYRKNLVTFIKTHVGKRIKGDILLKIPGRNGRRIIHASRRMEEVSSMDRLPFINWKNDLANKFGLRYGEWYLIDIKANLDLPLKNRGINKRIRSEVLLRYNSTCQRCGSKAGEVHHTYNTNTKIHISHKHPFILTDPNHKYSSEHFIALCSYCNEGEGIRIGDIKSTDNLSTKEIKYLNKIKKYQQKLIECRKEKGNV
jgi:hypothetical protein